MKERVRMVREKAGRIRERVGMAMERGRRVREREKAGRRERIPGR